MGRNLSPGSLGTWGAQHILAACRDTRDLLRFYTVLLSNPGLIGLSTRSVEQIRRPLRLVTVQGNEHYYFGQGVVSVEQDGSSVRQVMLRLNHASHMLMPFTGLCKSEV